VRWHTSQPSRGPGGNQGVAQCSWYLLRPPTWRINSLRHQAPFSVCTFCRAPSSPHSLVSLPPGPPPVLHAAVLICRVNARHGRPRPWPGESRLPVPHARFSISAKRCSASRVRSAAFSSWAGCERRSSSTRRCSAAKSARASARRPKPISQRFNADPSPHYFKTKDGGGFYLYATDDASNSGKYWDSTTWRLYTSTWDRTSGIRRRMAVFARSVWQNPGPSASRGCARRVRTRGTSARTARAAA
jgi:hypothetical protein